MGIHDRNYMNNGPQGGAPLGGGLPKSVTARFVGISGIIYLLDIFTGGQLSSYGLYSQRAVFEGFEIWRLLTSPFFLQPGAGIFIVLIELYIFYSLGNSVEIALGSRRFLNLLICCFIGVLALALFIPIAPAAGGFFGALLSAMFVAYGMVLGKQKFTLMLMFVLPLTLSGVNLVKLTFALVILPCLLGSYYWVIGLPMLGACGAAYWFMDKWRKGGDPDLLGSFKRGIRKKKPAKPKMNKFQKNFEVHKKEDSADDVDHYIQKNVDPILEKIAKTGMSSLSPAEKKILEDAKSKIGKG